MAEAGLFIGWGEVTRGREKAALGVWNESLQYYGRLQQEGKIERFDVVVLTPSGGEVGGFDDFWFLDAGLRTRQSKPRTKEPTMDVGTYLALGFLALLAAGVILVIHGTVVKNRWGINLRRVECPKCGTEMPRVRMPSSVNQALWGGSACPRCKCEMDKWGRPIAGSD